MSVDFTLSSLRRFAPRALPEYLDELAGEGKAVLAEAGILANANRLCHFMAQIAEETGGFVVKVESLTYTTPQRLMTVWPKRFPTVASALPFVRNPVALGDKVYGGRMGNVDPGDGFKYRGRGYLQTTGRDAYRKFGALIHDDLERNPDLVTEPPISLRCTTAEWTASKINAAADADDIEKVTRLVNGGLVGLDDRKAWLTKARKVFGAS